MKRYLQYELLALIDLLTIRDEDVYTVTLRKISKVLRRVAFKRRRFTVPLDDYTTLKINLAVDFKVAVYRYMRAIQSPYIVNHEVDTRVAFDEYSRRFSSVLNHIRTLDYYYGVLSDTPSINTKVMEESCE